MHITSPATINPYDQAPKVGQPNEKDRIQRYLREKNYEEALKELIFLLMDPDQLPSPDKVFTYLFELIPHLNAKYFCELVQNLQAFLDKSREFRKEQFSLAIQLGHKYRECHPSVPKAYSDAIHCFAKAIKIAEAENNQDWLREAHLNTSVCLLHLIQDHFLTPESFGKLLREARCSGNLGTFAALLERVKFLKKFPLDNTAAAYIEELYKQARDVLNSKGAPGDFNRFIAIIATERDSQQEDNHFITKEYHDRLKAFREAFTHREQFREVRSFQANQTNKLRELLQVFLQDAFAVLGEPPCSYDIRGVGSIGREEPCPFSDLECLILIENEEHRDYFAILLELLEIQIASLGESGGSLVFTCLSSKNISGFHIDPGGSPLRDPLLLGTPEKMASLQRLPTETNASDLPTVPPNQVLKSISLISQENSTLFFEFQRNMCEILDSKEKICLRHRRALQLFETRNYDFQKAWPRPGLVFPVHIKKQYLELLHFFLADLAFYFGLESTNTLDIIGELVKRDVIEEKTRRLLQESVSAIYRLRIRLHQFYGEQNEEVYLNHQAACVLTESEKRQLEKIYWLVLRPIYCCCLPVVLEKKQPVEQIFHNLDLISECLYETYASQEDSSFFIPLINSVVTHFVNIQEPIATHENVFRKLSIISNLQPLRRTYLEVLEKNHLPEHELEQLRSIPNRSGLRPLSLKKENQLKAQLKAISSPDFHREKASQVRIVSSLGVRYLNPEIVREILDEHGNIKSSYPGSAHSVCCAEGLHFKQKPTHPLMEYAIHNLFFRLAGDLTPATELVRFEVDGQKMYPVLISFTVSGITLKKRLEKPLTLETPHQWSRWTGMLLCSLLTRTGDGRTSNYIIDPNDNIFCIDNDISFVEPFVQKSFSSQVQFCSAPFCLFQNRSLARDVLEEFCSLDADSVLSGWIDDVIKKETEYLNLFSEEERKCLYDFKYVSLSSDGKREPLDMDSDNRFKATVLFREGALATLNTQFVYLQNQITPLLRQNQTVTPLELLKHIIALSDSPSLSNAPGSNIHRAYLKANQSSVEDRLKWITSRSQDKTLNSLKSDLACLGRVPTLEEVEKKKLFSPEKAREELYMSLLNRASSFLLDLTVLGKKTLGANFKEMTENKVPNLERQILVLRSLASLMSLKAQKPVSITLQYCAVLSSINLIPFLHKDLEYLDLRYCPQIKNSDVQLIQRRCPNLKELYLSGCSGLTAIEDGLLEALRFSNLRVLHFDRCKNLISVRLSSPCLKTINGERSPELNLVELMTCLKFEANFHKCPKFDKVKLERMNERDLEELSENIRNDELFILTAFKENWKVLKYASEGLKNNPEFVLAVVRESTGLRPAELGYYIEILNYGLKALEIRRKSVGEDQPEAALCYNFVGKILLKLGRYTEALQYSQKALEIWRNALNGDHPDTGTGYNSVGTILLKLGRYTEALEHQQRALAFWSEASDHSVMATGYMGVAESLLELGQYDKALQFHQKALEIRRDTLGELHPDTAESYNYVSINFDFLEQYDKALQFSQKALRININALGEDHPDTAECYNDLGICLFGSKQYAEVIPYKQKALEIWRKILGESHPTTAIGYMNLALGLAMLGKFEEALQHSQKALEICKITLGDHRSTAHSYKLIGIILTYSKHHGKAQQYFQKNLEILRKTVGEDNPCTAQAHEWIGRSLSGLEAHAEALQAFQTALQIRKKILGEEHATTAHSYYTEGKAFLKVGLYAEALQSHKKALKIRKDILGIEHASTATSYNGMGKTWLNLNHHFEALKAFRKTLEIREKC